MRYSLWSHGTLVGHTELDIPTVTTHMRQGFIEPTEEGLPALRDATGVNRTINENRHRRRLRGGEWADEDITLFQAACDRREALDFELRDENNQLFECEFMRVWDLHDMNSDRWRDDEEWETEYHLSQMTPEDRAELEAEMAADVELVEEMLEEREEDDMYHSSWPPPSEPDRRWGTMQYHLQVHLKGCFDETERRAVDLM